MGVIPNITEEDAKAIRDHAEDTLRANLRDASDKLDFAAAEVAKAEKLLDEANEVYWYAQHALNAFFRSKEISKNS